MAAAHPLPAPAASQPAAAGANPKADERALAPVPELEEQPAASAFAGPVARLLVELDVVIPLREFRVRNLLALAPGQVVESQWANGEDVPLAAGEVQLAWSEFEVIDTQLAVRVTRLA